MKRSLLLLILWGCGVTVGNSGPPPVAATSYAALVGMEHDEVINTAFDQNSNDASADLNLLAALLPEFKCTPLDGGGILVTRTDKYSVEFESGRPARRRVIQDALTRNADITLTLSDILGVLQCGITGRPILTWNQLIHLKSDETITRERVRTVTLKADGSALSQTTLNVSSTRSNAFSQVSRSLTTLVTNKSSSFSSNVKLKKDGTTTERTIQTLPNEPLVLQKTLTRGSGLTAAKIVSGAVSSINDDNRKIVLRYQNLSLGVGDSCHPTSGSIAGEVYADADATTAEATFTMEFTEDGAVLINADGTEEDVELEACEL